jgi:hypothetical protein
MARLWDKFPELIGKGKEGREGGREESGGKFRSQI